MGSRGGVSEDMEERLSGGLDIREEDAEVKGDGQEIMGDDAFVVGEVQFHPLLHKLSTISLPP